MMVAASETTAAKALKVTAYLTCRTETHQHTWKSLHSTENWIIFSSVQGQIGTMDTREIRPHE